MLLQAIDAADTTIATFTTSFTNMTICYFHNLQCSFSYNINSSMDLWGHVWYS